METENIKVVKGITYYKREIQGYNRGFIYKNYEAFVSGIGVCYIPEFFSGCKEGTEWCDSGYTRKDFNDICEGTKIDADYLFETVDWQHPETLYDEFLDNLDEDNVSI